MSESEPALPERPPQPTETRAESQANLDLGVIGNCSFSALIDKKGSVVWACMPRFDSNPVFCALLSDRYPGSEDVQGIYQIEIENFAKASQRYIDNTAVLITRLEDQDGQALEIIDFAPRYTHFGRRYRPMAIVRLVRPAVGAPRIRIRVRPRFDYGGIAPEITRGSNHIRYVGPDMTLRLTTSAPVSYVLNETWFRLERQTALFLGPDEPLRRSVEYTVDEHLDSTLKYWRVWVRHLAVPVEWQDAVIRAAITLKLCWYEETGAIIAAMTTSIPEAPDSGRNWDYRYCWLRDGYYVVQALNKLGAIDILEGYLGYLRNIAAQEDGGRIRPVYRIDLEDDLSEREIDTLAGYRGMGPVRVGNQAYEHLQHDVYGQIILSTAQAFYDQRLLRRVGQRDFPALEQIGEQAYRLHDQPDAGLWELRTKSRIHTYSSAMCWAACDRLSKIADHLRMTRKAADWRSRADEIHGKIMSRAWRDDLNSFVNSFDGSELDASLLQLLDLRFLDPSDARFANMIDAIRKSLRRGGYLYRYAEADDFGKPTTAFNICTFWYIEALAMIGRTDEAREIFETMLSARNHVGLLSEDIDTETRELWGNYPQTYSLVGVIHNAVILSKSWASVR